VHLSLSISAAPKPPICAHLAIAVSLTPGLNLSSNEVVIGAFFSRLRRSRVRARWSITSSSFSSVLSFSSHVFLFLTPCCLVFSLSRLTFTVVFSSGNKRPFISIMQRGNFFVGGRFFVSTLKKCRAWNQPGHTHTHTHTHMHSLSLALSHTNPETVGFFWGSRSFYDESIFLNRFLLFCRSAIL